MAFGNLGSSQIASVASFLQQPAEAYGNDASLEIQWAIAAYHHAQVYMNLLQSVDAKVLKLTPKDDEIYSEFRKMFPDLEVGTLDEVLIKSEVEKAKWRDFCYKFETKVENYNMGTLLRLKSDEEVNEDNSTLVPRIQFFAIEITRNREGLNSWLRERKAKETADLGAERQIDGEEKGSSDAKKELQLEKEDNSNLDTCEATVNAFNELRVTDGEGSM